MVNFFDFSLLSISSVETDFIYRYDSAVQMRDNNNENDKEQNPGREEECSAVPYSTVRGRF